MNCLKCGRETGSAQIFCPECLSGMADYPVKPGTPIQLPIRPKAPPAQSKAQKHHPRQPEEQLLHLRSSVRWLTAGLIFALLAFAAAAVMVLWLLDGPGFF